ncbi:MAG: ABC transporter ATP-binding protein [Lentisphaerae bacterium]|nr:ABC transporter ATP-binding protein [Lentisphaerota bacterium]
MRTSDIHLIRQILRVDRLARFLWATIPGWMPANILLVCIQGGLPLAGLYLLKQIVDATTRAIVVGGADSTWHVLLGWIGLAGIVALLTAVFTALSNVAEEAQSSRVADSVADTLHAQSAQLDLAYYDNPSYFDTLHRAQYEAPFRPHRMVKGLIAIGQNSVSLAGVALLLLSFNWKLGIVIALAAIPAALVRIRHANRLYAHEEKQAESERRTSYYHRILTESAAAQELRLFQFGSVFRALFMTLRDRLRKERLALVRWRVASDLAVHAGATLVSYGAMAFIAYQTFRQSITLGEMVMYFQAFQCSLSFLQAILNGMASLYEDNLFLTHYYQFLELKPVVSTPSDPRPVPAAGPQGIVFHDVAFTYPGMTTPALDGLNLSLPPRHVTALIGENGSGKTTLLKLLCRLYDPTAGRITFEGVDIREFDPLEWRRQISVLLQDFFRFNLSVKDSIALGQPGAEPDVERIRRSAQIAGIDPVIRIFPSQYDTILGREFQDGHELSGGEWQKIAISRALYRQARILVLDEPTSHLDAFSEARLFRELASEWKDRTVLLISHRFSTVRAAATIVVLDHGHVAESGSHDELMRRAGLYERLYRAQAGDIKAS